MSSPGYYKQGKKLEEGATYIFKYIKLVTLSDDQEYMILEDQYNIRHTVPYNYYINYKLTIGTEVECKVDKINCTGRVFLEPKHPLYREGEVYNFTTNIVNIENTNRTAIVDCFNNIIDVNINDKLFPGKIFEQVEARIIKITRGIPELEILSAC